MDATTPTLDGLDKRQLVSTRTPRPSPTPRAYNPNSILYYILFVGVLVIILSIVACLLMRLMRRKMLNRPFWNPSSQTSAPPPSMYVVQPPGAPPYTPYPNSPYPSSESLYPNSYNASGQFGDGSSTASITSPPQLYPPPPPSSSVQGSNMSSTNAIVSSDIHDPPPAYTPSDVGSSAK